MTRAGRWRRLAALALAWSSSACTSAAPPDDGASTRGDATLSEPAPLVDNHLWQPLDTASDPYAARLVDGAGCDYTSFLVEGADPPVLEVLTLICDFLTLSQPSLVDLAEGDALRIVVSHGPLAAPDSSPAEGFVAVRVGDTEIWTTTVPLPSTQSQSFQAEWIADRDYPAATPIAFHVDNHGTNSWRLLEITRLAR